MSKKVINVNKLSRTVVWAVVVVVLIIIVFAAGNAFQSSADTTLPTPDESYTIEAGQTKTITGLGATRLKCTNTYSATPTSVVVNGNVTGESAGAKISVKNVKVFRLGPNLTVSGANIDGQPVSQTLIPGKIISLYQSLSATNAENDFTITSSSSAYCDIRFSGTGSITVAPTGGSILAETYSGATLNPYVTINDEYTFPVSISREVCKQTITVTGPGETTTNSVATNSDSPAIDKNDGTLKGKIGSIVKVSATIGKTAYVIIKDPKTYGQKINVVSSCTGGLTAVQAK